MSPQRLAVATVVTISVGYTVNTVILVSSSGSFPHIALMAGALAGFFLPHYVHVRAALRGVRLSGPPWGLIVQAVAAYAPILAFGAVWGLAVPPILAGSALIRLGLRTGLPILAAMMACQAVWTATMPPYGTVFAGFYYGLTVFITGFVLYAVTRLVVVTRELSEARAELAEAAVLRERLRISRDLHDGLGRSLTAIALKGDLAARLVETEPGRARAEVGELARVAREAAQDVRRVARGYREMSLEQEVHRAVALLEASGVECQVNLADAELPRPVEEVLAWAVREGVTNVLRHSAATTCSITTSAAAGGVRLEIVNNGASAAGDGTGSGLAGLAERAAAVAGRVEAGRAGPEGFRLAVEAAT